MDQILELQINEVIKKTTKPLEQHTACFMYMLQQKRLGLEISKKIIRRHVVSFLTF